MGLKELKDKLAFPWNKAAEKPSADTSNAGAVNGRKVLDLTADDHLIHGDVSYVPVVKPKEQDPTFTCFN